MLYKAHDIREAGNFPMYETKRQDADAAYGLYERKRHDADAAYGLYEK